MSAMTFQEFQKQMDRIKNTFGDRTYPQERTKVLWSEVAKQTAGWMEKTVTGFIASRQLNNPPLPMDFSQALREQRDLDWERGKSERAREAQEFWTDAPPAFFSDVIKSIR